jgi:hypothetical protein
VGDEENPNDEVALYKSGNWPSFANAVCLDAAPSVKTSNDRHQHHNWRKFLFLLKKQNKKYDDRKHIVKICNNLNKRSKRGMFVHIYLADLVISEEKGSKRFLKKYYIFIKEIKSPFSVKLKTIAPVSFGDSLCFLRNEEGFIKTLHEDVQFRMIECTENAKIHFIFKSVNQLYMFAIRINLKKSNIEITSYEWNQPQQKYFRIHTHQLLAVEKQLIYCILQSLHIRSSEERRSLFFALPPKKKADPKV